MHSHTHEVTIWLSFLLGAIHALEPGHGKSAMFVYLLGGRRSFWHPIVMALMTAVTHSISLFGIALAVHVAHHLFTGDHHHENQVSRVLQICSAVLVLGVGVYLLVQAFRGRQVSCCKHHHDNDLLEHKHDCCSHPLEVVSLSEITDDTSSTVHQYSTHTTSTKRGNYRTTALLGLAVGLLPCPSALAAYFTGLSTGSPAQAYLIVALFGAGMACSLGMVGILLQHFGDRLGARLHRAQHIPWAYVRACLILGIGVFYALRLMLETSATVV